MAGLLMHATFTERQKGKERNWIARRRPSQPSNSALKRHLKRSENSCRIRNYLVNVNAGSTFLSSNDVSRWSGLRATRDSLAGTAPFSSTSSPRPPLRPGTMSPSSPLSTRPGPGRPGPDNRRLLRLLRICYVSANGVTNDGSNRSDIYARLCRGETYSVGY